MSTVIKNTFRYQDVIPAFAGELASRSPNEDWGVHQWVNSALQGHIDWPEDDHVFWDTEGASDLREWLEDRLNTLAPAGTYFGSHPGSGSDFGFWPNEEELSA